MSLSRSSALVVFSFYTNSKFTGKDLLIGQYNRETNTFPIQFTDPDTGSTAYWNCPKPFLQTYIFDFFHFIHSDSNMPSGFQLDCALFPAILMPLKNSDHCVKQALEKVLHMLEMFVAHGNPGQSFH